MAEEPSLPEEEVPLPEAWFPAVRSPMGLPLLDVWLPEEPCPERLSAVIWSPQEQTPAGWSAVVQPHEQLTPAGPSPVVVRFRESRL